MIAWVPVLRGFLVYSRKGVPRNTFEYPASIFLFAEPFFRSWRRNLFIIERGRFGFVARREGRERKPELKLVHAEQRKIHHGSSSSAPRAGSSRGDGPPRGGRPRVRLHIAAQGHDCEVNTNRRRGQGCGAGDDKQQGKRTRRFCCAMGLAPPENGIEVCVRREEREMFHGLMSRLMNYRNSLLVKRPATHRHTHACARTCSTP